MECACVRSSRRGGSHAWYVRVSVRSIVHVCEGRYTHLPHALNTMHTHSCAYLSRYTCIQIQIHAGIVDDMEKDLKNKKQTKVKTTTVSARPERERERECVYVCSHTLEGDSYT